MIKIKILQLIANSIISIMKSTKDDKTFYVWLLIGLKFNSICIYNDIYLK